MFPLYPHDISIETLGLILYQVASVPHHHNPVAAATLDLIDAKLNHVRSTVPAVRAVVGCLPAVGGCRVQKKKKQKKTWNSWVTPSKNCVLWELLSALFFGLGSGIGVVFGIRNCYLPNVTTKSQKVEVPAFCSAVCVSSWESLGARPAVTWWGASSGRTVGWWASRIGVVSIVFPPIILGWYQIYGLIYVWGI